MEHLIQSTLASSTPEATLPQVTRVLSNELEQPDKVRQVLVTFARLLASRSPIVLRFACRVLERFHVVSLDAQTAAAQIFNKPAEHFAGKIRRFSVWQPTALPVTAEEVRALQGMLENAFVENWHFSVMRRALATFTKLHPIILAQLAAPEATDELRALAAAHAALLAFVQRSLLSVADTGTRLQGVKFCEVVIGTCTPPREDSDAAVLFSVNKAADSALLKVDELTQLGQELTKRLLSSLEEEDSSVATSILGSLTSLARQRPALAPQIIAGLIDLASRRPRHLSASQYTALQHVLKCHLMFLDKLRCLEEEQRMDVFNCLTNDLNVRAEFLEHKRRREAGTQDDTAAQQPTKRAKYDVQFLLQKLPPVHAMNPATTAELVIRFMQNMPAVPVAAPAQATAESEAPIKQLPPLPKKLLALPIASDMAEKLVLESYNRILKSNAPTKQTRARLLVRLAQNRALDHEVPQALLDHCAEHLAVQREVALLWLYQEWMRGSSVHSTERYVTLLEELIRRAVPFVTELDLSLSVFLVDIPALTEGAVELVSEVANDPAKALAGLDALRNLLLRRPTESDAVLEKLLGACGASMERVRVPAIEMVASEFYSKDRFQGAVFEHAESLMSAAVSPTPDPEYAELEMAAEKAAALAEMAKAEAEKVDEELAQAEQAIQDALRALKATDRDAEAVAAADAAQKEAEEVRTRANLKRQVATTTQSHSVSSQVAADEWVEAHVSLFMELCTKDPSLLSTKLLGYYATADRRVRRLLHGQATKLVAALGPEEPMLLDLVSKVPEDASSLGLHMLHAMTEGQDEISSAVVSVAKEAAKRLDDSRLLVPVVTALSMEELVPTALLKVLSLPESMMLNVLERLLVKSNVPPTLLFVAMHTLPGVVDACDEVAFRGAIAATHACITRFTNIFNQENLARALRELVERTEVPHLFMRTVILCIGQFPRLTRFVLATVMSTLVVQRKVWEAHDNVWKGFIKCARVTLPNSIPCLTSLPEEPLETLLQEEPAFVKPLADYTRTHPVPEHTRIVAMRQEAAALEQESAAAEAAEGDAAAPEDAMQA